MPYIVIRKPVLMEDEGRHHHIAIYDHKHEAENWVNDQEGEYHGPKDYYIVEVPYA